jgi:outer membrane protein insertion porin family
MVILNHEVRVPVYRWIRGVAFIDGGNVFPGAGDLTLRALAGSAGFGLRLSTPFALLRADYGRVMWGADRVGWGNGPRSGRWVIGIGQAF